MNEIQFCKSYHYDKTALELVADRFMVKVAEINPDELDRILKEVNDKGGNLDDAIIKCCVFLAMQEAC